jgi:hypothetical protein
MVKVFASTVIATPAANVWAVLRNFIGLTVWSNAVTGARITNGKATDQVGAVRHLEIADGSAFVESLLALSDEEMFLKYDIVEGPIPVADYVAQMRVQPVTDGDLSYVTWSAEFSTPDAEADAMREIVGEQICAGGLTAMKSYFEAKN